MQFNSGWKKVVFVPMDRIGDAISDTPALCRLRELGVEIIILSTSYTAEIFADNPCVSEVISFSRSKKDGLIASLMKNRMATRRIRSLKPDAVLGMMRPIRELKGIYSALDIPVINKPNNPGDPIHMRWVNFFNSIGIESAPSQNSLYPSLTDKAVLSEWFAKNGFDPDRPILTVHPGCAVYKDESQMQDSIRYWRSENYIEVFSMLPKDVQIALTGVHPSEIEENRKIMKASPLKTAVFDIKSLKALACLISASRALLSLDTGTLHVGASTETPIAAIFGPTTPDKYGPFRKNITYVKAEPAPECWPCDHNATCGGDNVCMRRITPVQVYEAIQKVLL
jgi:ADP-heptose:LPS heptosyltransferase